MGLFGSKSENKSSNAKVTWTALENLGQLNEIKTISADQNVLIFKHSTRCSISRMALKQFENEYENKLSTVNYFLDLLNYRDISTEIATTFNVQHQSPQLLLIKNDVCIYNVSHSDIDAESIDKMKLQDL